MPVTVLRKSPLFPTSQEAGAGFIESAGWQIADHYGDAAAEHLAVRGAAGLIDLSHRGKIEVTGADRATFLHAMLTNDIKNLQPGGGLYAGMVNANGKLLADLRVYCFDDRLLLDCGTALTGKIVQTLSKYIIMEDVTLKDRTGELGFMAVEGPRAAEILGGLAKTAVPARDSHHAFNIEGFEAEIIGCSLSGETGFALLCTADSAVPVWKKLMTAGRNAGLRPFGRSAANTLRLEAGFPWYGVDMDERNLLPETGLREAVSYNKGCYIGQEVIARLDSVAQVNQKLMGLEISGQEVPAAAESRLTVAGKPAGYLTSAAFSPTLKRIIGLGYLKRDFAKAGTDVLTETAGKTIQARAVELPFVPRRST